MLHLGTLAAILVYYRHVGVDRREGPARLDRGRRRRIAGRPWSGPACSAVVATLAAGPAGALPQEEDRGGLREPDGRRGRLPDHGGRLAGHDPAARAARRGRRETTWLDALLIGVAQAFAPLPGVSRSGLTIAAALALGLSRPWAVGFSLLMAVPAILGAAVLELKDVDPHDARPATASPRPWPPRSSPGSSATGRSSGWSGLSGRGGYGIFLYTWSLLGLAVLASIAIAAAEGVRRCRPRRLWTGPYGSALRDG